MFNPTPAMAGWFGYPLELDDRLRLISEAGFKAVLLWWATSSAYEPPIPKKAETAAKHGLAVENAHLHFAGVNSLWEASEVKIYKSKSTSNMVMLENVNFLERIRARMQEI